MLLKITNSNHKVIYAKTPKAIQASRNVDNNSVTWALEVFKDAVLVQFARNEPELMQVRVKIKNFANSMWEFSVYVPWAPIGSSIDGATFSDRITQWLNENVYDVCAWSVYTDAYRAEAIGEINDKPESARDVDELNDTRYINCDYIAEPKRHAPSMNTMELCRLMLKPLLTCSASPLCDVMLDDEVQDAILRRALIYFNRYHDAGDNKYCIEFDNILLAGDVCTSDINLMGFQRLSNGIPFFGFQANAPWGMPVFSIIYFDGTSLRLYTPTKGNLVNADLQRPFGTECVILQSDKRYKKLYDKYAHASALRLDKDGNLLPDKSYMAYYGLSPDTVYFNWYAIRDDISKTLYLSK